MRGRGGGQCHGQVRSCVHQILTSNSANVVEPATTFQSRLASATASCSGLAASFCTVVAVLRAGGVSSRIGGVLSRTGVELSRTGVELSRTGVELSRMVVALS